MMIATDISGTAHCVVGGNHKHTIESTRERDLQHARDALGKSKVQCKGVC